MCITVAEEVKTEGRELKRQKEEKPLEEWGSEREHAENEEQEDQSQSAWVMPTESCFDFIA